MTIKVVFWWHSANSHHMSRISNRVIFRMKSSLSPSLSIFYPLCLHPDEQVSNLIDKALEARQRAHCPYSKFSVGAALLEEGGRVILGWVCCNISNIIYFKSNETLCTGTCSELNTVRPRNDCTGKLFPNTELIFPSTMPRSTGKGAQYVTRVPYEL